jgi:hypothetical protein
MEPTDKCICGHSAQNHFINGCMYFGEPNKKVVCECREYVEKKCVCCNTNKVGTSSVMCENCWDWITEKMTIGDIALVVAGIAHREPDNKHAVEIRDYIVADNYLYGKAKLPTKCSNYFKGKHNSCNTDKECGVKE